MTRRRLGWMGVLVAVGLMGLVGTSSAKTRTRPVRHRQNTVVLLGRRTVTLFKDKERADRSEAFPFTAVRSGITKRVRVYIDRGTRAKALIVGIYSNSHHHPSRLLTSGLRRRVKAGAWNTLSLKAVRIQSGQTYWIAVLGRGGQVAYRDQATGRCRSQESMMRVALTRLPSRWRSGPSWPTCHLSTYVMGPGTHGRKRPGRRHKPVGPGSPGNPGTPPHAGSTSAPVNTALPKLSGQTIRGRTLTATAGSWSNSPTSYTYRWEDCSATGAGCTAISGTSSSSHVLATGDVNHTVRVAVTATNSAGSASATSAQTAKVTAAATTTPVPPPVTPPVGGTSSTCTKTLTSTSLGSSPYPGAALETALKSAAGGSTICLSSGSAGQIEIYGVAPSSNVTVQPSPGAVVNLDTITVGANTHNITFAGFSGINGVGIGSSGSNCCSNLAFTYDTFTGGSSVRDVVNSNIVFAHDTFNNINACSNCYEGRIEVVSSNVSQNDGVTIEDSVMSGGDSDGVQDDGIGTQILNNVFSNIIESNCGVIHCDAIQTVGATGTVISGNYFYNTTDCFLMDNGGGNITIKNNECGPMAADSSFWIQFGGISGMTFTHNTITATTGGSFGTDNGNPSSNVTWTNNIEYSSPSLNPGQSLSGTTNESYNLVKQCGTLCGGSHDIVGSPKFAGGTSPSTWAGFALASGSLGAANASDGLNRGISSFSVTPGP
jgi:hypothetical protein